MDNFQIEMYKMACDGAHGATRFRRILFLAIIRMAGVSTLFFFTSTIILTF
jgi:hypothetical protein